MPSDEVTRTRAPRCPGTPGLRAGLAGATCATGAMAAHVSAGGDVSLVAAVLTLAASTLLGPLLLTRSIDPARTFALSLVAQVVWHAAFVLTATGAPMAHHASTTSTTEMALHHLVAAVLAVAVAVGAERSLAAAADWLVGVALPVVVRAVALATPVRPAPAYAALARVPAAEPHDPASPLRAPPAGRPLG